MGCASSVSTSPISIHELYAFHEKLGQGAFGQVRTCVHRNTEREYAVKILNVEGSATRRQEAQREGFLWKQAGGHRNIVSLIEAYNDQDFSYFVMEKCERSLVNMLLEQPGIQEADVLCTFRQMLLGLEHCHKMKVVHRDVKPANYLVSRDGIVKLCDFGLAEVEKPTGIFGIIGTAPFMSPEMVLGNPYDQKTDIWSFGATAYMMLYGRYLYKINRDAGKKAKKVRATDLMKRAIATNSPEPTYEAGSDLPEPSATARGFIQALLQRDPTKRMTASQCLKLDALLPRLPSKAKAPSNARSLVPAIRLVKQATEEFKAPIDPTVAKSMDELINQLQKKFNRPTSQFGTTLSLPTSGEKSLGCSLAYSKWSPTFSHGGEMSMSPTLLQSLRDDDCPKRPKTGLTAL